MPNMTLALPEDLHKKMRARPQVKWSEVARSAFRDRLLQLEYYDRLLAGPKLTEQDAIELGRDIRRRVVPRHKK
jgi:hypothetical protein